MSGGREEDEDVREERGLWMLCGDSSLDKSASEELEAERETVVVVAEYRVGAADDDKDSGEGGSGRVTLMCEVVAENDHLF